ncbi:MAG TPA: glycosyltransferase, partial [Rhodoferax sp.]
MGGLNAGSRMSQQPLVSVCIANYNGIAVIDDCLRSVLGQQGDIPVEILLHDDASTDGSVAHIRENYPNVVLIESEVNV